MAYTDQLDSALSDCWMFHVDKGPNPGQFLMDSSIPLGIQLLNLLPDNTCSSSKRKLVIFNGDDYWQYVQKVFI